MRYASHRTLAFLLVMLVVTTGCTPPTRGTISGRAVTLENGAPVPGAVVRVQATANSTASTEDGSFTLGGLTDGVTVTVTAWYTGYHPGGVAVVPPQEGITIPLKLHPTGDNPDHVWLTSMPDPDVEVGCGHCMFPEFDHWRNNAHGQAGTNPRFFSMYNGTRIGSNEAVAPAYKLDFPGTTGNCATCHAPGAAANRPFFADMNALQDVEAEGVFCDFCHKIGDAYLDPATGLPYPNMPGVLSYRLYRPPVDTHMFFGPLDDVTRRVAYLELEKQSQFCAPCHQFSFWGTPIYASFKEWLESPYSDPETGKTCQECHMVPDGATHFVLPEKGGLKRPPETLPSHLQPGASDEELLRNTVEMQVKAERTGDLVRVTVTIANTEAGHHVPTDYPGRHMLLVVEAVDERGRALPLLEGPTVPEWGGDHAGRPGAGYAKLLRDVETGEFPVVNYWKQTLIVSDNRIPAFGSDTTTYAFRSDGGEVTVHARLLFRRLFQPLAERYGWELGEILMESEVVKP